jgi:riboflavin synthase alpha subunit
MKLIRLPAVNVNLYVRLADREFVHLVNGQVIGHGHFTFSLNNDNVEAVYHRGDETEARQIVLNVGQLHYDGVSDSGFCLGEVQHDYSEIPELKSKRDKD